QRFVVDDHERGKPREAGLRALEDALGDSHARKPTMSAPAPRLCHRRTLCGWAAVAVRQRCPPKCNTPTCTVHAAHKTCMRCPLAPQMTSAIRMYGGSGAAAPVRGSGRSMHCVQFY